MQISPYLSFIFSKARFTPYSLRCQYELSSNSGYFSSLPIGALGPISLPEELNCSANQLSVTVTIGTICTLISSVEFLVGATIVCAWINHMICSCETVLANNSPTLAETKDVLCQYETLRVAVDRFVFQMFTAPQIVAVLAFYICSYCRFNLRLNLFHGI